MVDRARESAPLASENCGRSAQTAKKYPALFREPDGSRQFPTPAHRPTESGSTTSEPQNIFHSIQSRLLLHHPLRGGQCAGSKIITRPGVMKQLQAFAGTRENDAVVAHNFAFAN